MSMNDLFGGLVKPKLITRYTSGTGTHVPTVDMARCLVRVQAGGAGGVSAGTVGGGGGGAMVEAVMRIPIAGLAYAVGAGGAASTSGSASTFGNLRAMGGQYDASTSGGYGGLLGILGGSVSATNVSVGVAGVRGVPGGAGGSNSTDGLVAGQPVGGPTLVISPLGNLLPLFTNGQGNKSGGNSFFGIGGATQASPAAGNYGAGGGGGASPAAGLGGCIEIWDFGA